MKTTGLMSFLKGTTNPKDGLPGCANYDHHYGGCIFMEKCFVEEGKRCEYFERAVLPTALQQNLLKIVEKYQTQIQDIVNVKPQNVRLCQCGEPLKPRHRYCEKCIKQRRRDTYRKEKQKQRKLNG